MAVDLTKLDEYADGHIPDGDVETCLKVLRTLRNICLGPHVFFADGALILSHAHAQIVDLVKLAEANEAKAEDTPHVIGG